MVSKILLFQGMSNNSGIDEEVIVPNMVKVTVGIDEDIDIFRPGLFGNFPAPLSIMTRMSSSMSTALDLPYPSSVKKIYILLFIF